MRLQTYLIESSFVLTIKDIEQVAMKAGGRFRSEAEKNAEQFLDWWYEKPELKKDLGYFFKAATKAGQMALKMLGPVPYYNRNDLINNILDTQEFPTNPKDFFPIPIYISSGKNDRFTVGILIHANGKKELFEGNDEATSETYDLVDKILGNVKPVTVYGYHGEKTVEDIRRTNTLPEGLYMSPDKKYALGYWSLKENRIPFSCVAMSNAFRKESDKDWKVKKDTKIKNFKFI